MSTIVADTTATRTLTHTERDLLAKVHAWARRNGYQPTGWLRQLYRDHDGIRTEITWDPADARIYLHVRRLIDGRPIGEILREATLPVQSVTEAVDLLVAVGALPATFASSFRARQVEIDRLTAELVVERRRCECEHAVEAAAHKVARQACAERDRLAWMVEQLQGQLAAARQAGPLAGAA
jgi:hypothetical protein